MRGKFGNFPSLFISPALKNGKEDIFLTIPTGQFKPESRYMLTFGVNYPPKQIQKCRASFYTRYTKPICFSIGEGIKN